MFNHHITTSDEMPQLSAWDHCKILGAGVLFGTLANGFLWWVGVL